MAYRISTRLVVWWRLGIVCVLIGAGVVVARSGADVPGSSAAGRSVVPVVTRGLVSPLVGERLPGYSVVGLRARNPAQGFSARFSRRGAIVYSRAARVGIALTEFGYASRLRGVGSVAPRASWNRVSYRYGAVTASWANDPLGLEQGFDVRTRPAPGSGPLTLMLALSGGLSARLERGSLELSGHGAALSYGDLIVADARGHVLRSWFRASRGRLLIQVDDRGASFPLRIDPYLYASNGHTGDGFGSSVAASGQTVVVGAPGHDNGKGEAYVFTRPAGQWYGEFTEMARLSATHLADGDGFGASVAISGSTIVIGAPGRDGDKGEAYVFVKPRSGWRSASENAQLLASNGAKRDQFGQSVAISGDTIVVGAPIHNNGKGGEAYVFVEPHDGWGPTRGRVPTIQETARLYASDGKTLCVICGVGIDTVGSVNESFGNSVGISGDNVVVGAPCHRNGQAYIFVRPRSGWATKKAPDPSIHESAKLDPSNASPAAEFGWSVGISGDTVIVGAPQQNGVTPSEGEAYLFVKPEKGWSGKLDQTTKLTHPNAATEPGGPGVGTTAFIGDAFGSSVSIAGDTLVVGAPTIDLGAPPERGRGYTITKPASGWPGEPPHDLSAESFEQRDRRRFRTLGRGRRQRADRRRPAGPRCRLRTRVLSEHRKLTRPRCCLGTTPSSGCTPPGNEWASANHLRAENRRGSDAAGRRDPAPARGTLSLRHPRPPLDLRVVILDSAISDKRDALAGVERAIAVRTMAENSTSRSSAVIRPQPERQLG